MEAIVTLLREFGPFTLAIVVVFAYFWDKSHAANKTENTVSDIAGNSSRELSEVHKQIGDIRQQLGMAQGQNIVLMDNLKTVEQKRDASDVVMKDKIFALEQADKNKTILIARHEGRIAELETEGKRKDETIKTKELIILDLTEQNTRLKTDNELLETDNKSLHREIALLNRKQSLDETIPLGDELLAQVDNVQPIPTTEELKKAG